MPEILDILGIQLIFFFFYKHIKYCVKLAHLKKKKFLLKNFQSNVINRLSHKFPDASTGAQANQHC